MMFHVPFITDNTAFASLTDRIRRTKYLIPVTVLVLGYTIAIIAVVLSSSKMNVGGDGVGLTTKPPEQGEGVPTTRPPTETETEPGTPETPTPSGASTPAGQTTKPGQTTTPTTPTTTAPGGTTTPGSTTKPGATTTKPPTTPTTPTPTTTKPPTTPTTPATTTTKPPTTPTTPTTTKPPTGPTTKAPTGPTTRPPGGVTTTYAPSTTGPSTPTPTGLNVTLHPPAELGNKRGFCFRNSCSETIWVGQIGAATGLQCGAGCPKGTICNTNKNPNKPSETLGCYFSLPFPASKVKLDPGQFFCLAFDFPSVITNVFMPDNTVIHLDVQWSGAIYASTNCDDDLMCQTGICKECTETECHECPSYRGPVGPVAQAELTLSGVWKDYYDTTLIHGANLPLVTKPMTYQPNFWPDQYQKPAYHCGSPGSPYTVGDSPGASWDFKRVASQSDKQLARPLVFGGSKTPCVWGGACPAGEQCGVSMGLTERNQPRADVGNSVCGKPAGIWSRSELCGWTEAEEYEDCTTKPFSDAGTIMQLYKCSGPHAESCFQRVADSTCCGCTVWPDFIPTHGEECHWHNPRWEQVVMPHLEQIKRACPTCYTYPYDDSTALYTCWDDELWNAASYEFEWCPMGKTVKAY
jgi:hypothetical protein